jgi:guanyl-specific ribonuclease Sa
MKPLLGLFLLSCCFTCFGCGGGQGQSQGKLDGDVFIVTAGAQNVKLGLVEVRVLPYEETKNSIAKTRAQAEREVAKLQPQLDAARRVRTSAEGRNKAANAEYVAATNRAIAAIGDDSFSALNEAEGAAFNWEMAASEAVGSAKNAIAELEKQARRWNSGALYFASLPSPAASVKTDADGKFSIPLDRMAKVVLAANATRRLPNKTENYYWLVTVSLDGQPSKRIFLSNDNLATSDSKDSLVHVAE